MSQIILQTSNLLDVDKDLVAKVADYQFEYLSKFFVRPTTAEIYLKNLGTFFVYDYSVKRMISKWIHKVKSGTLSEKMEKVFLDDIKYWYSKRFDFYYYNRKIRRNPNKARQSIVELNKQYLKKLKQEDGI